MTTSNRPFKESLTDDLIICSHGWPVEIALCPQCQADQKLKEKVHKFDKNLIRLIFSGWTCPLCNITGNESKECRYCGAPAPNV